MSTSHHPMLSKEYGKADAVIEWDSCKGLNTNELLNFGHNQARNLTSGRNIQAAGEPRMACLDSLADNH